ncbi:MAG TPA: glycosyl hydrolase [Woeseiaceae bacterium]|nr:glycosyl hydrolase [Woeseiaceae bacterium]
MMPVLHRFLPLFATVTMCVGITGPAAAADADAFLEPPPDARPMTLWFWMNGHVSREGITLDLEAMSRVGIGGAIIFDGSNYFPEGPAPYMSETWLELMAHAVREGERLGVDIGMHNAPGWSSSGGPWIAPDDSMKHLAWSETRITGNRDIDVLLPEPQALLDYYRDVRVLAWPTPRAEATAFRPALSGVTHGREGALPPALLTDQRLESSVPMRQGDTVTLEFAAPVEARSLTVNSGLTGNTPNLRVESSADGVTYEAVAEITSHGRHGIIAPTSVNFGAVTGRHFRLVALGDGTLGEVALDAVPRIVDWEYKSNLAYRVGAQAEVPPTIAASDAIDPAQVIDLTGRMTEDGRLRWRAPPGDWTLLRLGYTTTAHLNVAASAAGTGLESDKLDPAATDLSFANTVGRVAETVGRLAGKSFAYVEIDSYEAGMQNWTAAFPAEFAARAGYDITPYLPALTGRYVGDAGISERFLFDFRSVQAEMMAEHYYGRMAGLARARGLDLYVEGYGQGMFDELEVSGRAPVPMTEFWVRTPWTPNRTVKMVSSAAHVYGKPVVAAEAFTGEEETSRWLGYPYAFKAEGDYMFSLGLNQLIFHRYAHQPHPSAVPGMAMGPWGIHFERTNTWFAQSGPWLDYLARSQYLLRQGRPVADVLFFTGERPPNNSQMLRPAMPAGFDYDQVDAHALLERVTIDDGDFVLPEGNRYRLLVLPESLTGMTPALAEALAGFVDAGASVMGPRPTHSLTLRNFPASEAELERVAARLWAAPRPGEPSVLPTQPLAEVLARLGVAPDFSYTAARPDAAISWTHRRLNDGELYFIGNRQRRAEDLTASFRATGGVPEIWNAETGERTRAALFTVEDGRTRIPLRLDPAGSVFVLIPDAPPAVGARTLTRNGEVLVASDPAPATPLPATAGTFTMAAWVKPDIGLRLMPEESTDGQVDETGKFYAIAAPEGDRLFGEGHAAAGLAVGRNGMFVIERSSAKSPAVLVAERPVAGWTHVAVVYEEGRPSLYVDGEWVRDGLASGAIVHPAAGLPAPPADAVLHFRGLDGIARASGVPLPSTQGRVYTFEGNLADPVVFDRALAADDIAQLAARGVPAPEPPAAAEVHRAVAGGIVVTAFRSGRYSIDDGATVDIEVPAPIDVAGPWQVSFQPGRGAPASAVLPELASLHRHADAGIRHFSGSATYRHAVDVAPAWLGADRRVVLDLGRVEVLAVVRVNGTAFPAVWKEPYRVDVTGAVRAGSNRIEIDVVNLWTNRLIGDAQLPAEVEFGYGSDGSDSPFYGKGVKAFPDWFRDGEDKPEGGRVTFTTWDFYAANEPLVASGLLGPVRLYNPVIAELP